MQRETSSSASSGRWFIDAGAVAPAIGDKAARWRSRGVARTVLGQDRGVRTRVALPSARPAGRTRILVCVLLGVPLRYDHELGEHACAHW